MKWNVFYHDFNARKITTYNIFDHGSFYEDVQKALQECDTKEKFERKLKTNLRYYFWAKSEWEILISPWIGNDRDKKLKVDVYEQVMNNWEVFLDYVYGHRG